MIRRSIILTAALCAILPARAEFVDGHVLRRMLKLNPVEGQAYLMGAHDASRGSAHCSPSTLKRETLALIAEGALMHTKPADMSESGDVLLVRALAAIWPCGRRT